MIKAIAIDDEPRAIDVIIHHAKKLNSIELISTFNSSEKALEYVKNNPVDLIFLDINMPVMNGLELLQSLQSKPQVIFTTAYSEFAVESYNYDAIDYLLKPFEFDRFQLAVLKAIQKIETIQSSHSFFFIKDGFKNIKIEPDQILFIKSAGNYLDIHTEDKVHSPRMTFHEILQKVSASNFIRVHQSYVISINSIDKIENNHIFIKDHKIPISSSYKNEVYDRLGI